MASTRSFAAFMLRRFVASAKPSLTTPSRLLHSEALPLFMAKSSSPSSFEIAATLIPRSIVSGLGHRSEFVRNYGRVPAISESEDEEVDDDEEWNEDESEDFADEEWSEDDDEIDMEEEDEDFEDRRPRK